MARVCMRPGCDRPAAARLSYDTISCQVWLDQMPERLGPVQEICQFHAERLTVPRGWTLCDRRVDAPALFEPDHRAVQLGEAASLGADGAGAGEVAEVIAVVPRRAGARGASTTAPRRSNRRRHPSSTARQLFDEGLDVAPPSVPTIDLDSDLDPEPTVDLDADLDELEVDAPAAGSVALVVEDEELVVEVEVEVVEVVVEEVDELVVEELEVLVIDEAVEEQPEVAHLEVPESEAADGLSEVLVAAARADRDGERRSRAMPEHAEIMAEIVSVDLEDDLPESLRATSPLLARAFRATGPQRSVLSPDLASPVERDEGESAEA